MNKNISKQNQDIIKEPYVLKKYEDYCRLYLYGEVVSPDEMQDIFVKLNEYADELDTIEIFINSIGGDLITTIDLMNILERFTTVITINAGEASSAGFFIWAKGNIRLTYKYAMFMAHRESYGMIGKTKEHKNYVQKIDKIYGKLYEELFSKILTEDELKLSETTEVWLSAEDIVERGIGLYYDDYLKGMLQIEEIYKSPISNKYYKFDGEKFIELKISEMKHYDSELDIIKNELGHS
jgi:ATP-dependent protease ClpP protease subunit